MNERLYRSVDDRVLAGVAGGLADKFGIDPSIVRIVWALLAIASGGVFILIYIVMAIVVPEDDAFDVYAPPAPTGQSGASASAAPGDPGGPAAAGGVSGGVGFAQPASSPAQWRAHERAERRAARLARRAERGPGQGPLVFGVVLIVLGAWFLVRQYLPDLNLDRLWPFAMLGLGVLLLAFSVGGRPGGSGEAPK